MEPEHGGQRLIESWAMRRSCAPTPIAGDVREQEPSSEPRVADCACAAGAVFDQRGFRQGARVSFEEAYPHALNILKRIARWVERSASREGEVYDPSGSTADNQE